MISTDITHAVSTQGAALVELSHRIHALAELGFEEHRTAALIKEFLTTRGFECELGVGGLDTALRARVGTTGPTVAFLAEYDALPGIGHACGHNVIAASAIGAFLALAAVRTPGRIILLGTPAEENGTGKEIMARAGVFDTVDAAFMVHPGGGYDTVHGRSLGLREVEIVFHGVASHASAAPEKGRNALDAAVATYQGISALRQEILAEDRVHGIITDGGARPNVIPERAALHYYVRSASATQLLHLSDRVENIARGAAQMTGTEVEFVWDRNPACVPLQHNEPLDTVFERAMQALGRPLHTTTEQHSFGSTDAGNISVRIPTIHPLVAIAPDDVVPHTAPFAAAACSARADETILAAATALAHTAAGYLTDPELRHAAQRAWDESYEPAVERLLAL